MIWVDEELLRQGCLLNIAMKKLARLMESRFYKEREQAMACQNLLIVVAHI